ncbi:MAG TPA: glycosyltransferase [Gaiellaceae bacterium]
MKILIVDPYYPGVLEAHYRSRPDLAGQSYDTQWRALMDLAFGTSDAYSFGLRAAGHEGHEIVPNCAPLQRAWAREHRPRLARLPWRLAAPAILVEQAAWYQPDVVYVQSIGAFHPLTLRLLRRRTNALAGQLASRPPQKERVRMYDVLFTSFPHFVGRLPVPTHLLRIGFDDRVLQRIDAKEKRYDVVFVGQLGGGEHGPANDVLEAAAAHVPVEVWGPGLDDRSERSPFRTRHHGVVWGIEMLRVLAGSRIALNRHIAAAEGHANNMRLFEATGVGAMLLTDAARGLDTLFEPDREVVTYTSAGDLVEKARWYLEHEDERAAIAAAGHARTLSDHTYVARMRELVSILKRYVS